MIIFHGIPWCNNDANDLTSETEVGSFFYTLSYLALTVILTKKRSNNNLKDSNEDFRILPETKLDQ